MTTFTDSYPPSHPVGAIRLASSEDLGGDLDLAPQDLESHVFIPGVSGSGKTTTLTRLAEGALHLGWPVVIVDCKGGDLRGMAEQLSNHAAVPFHLYDPRDEASLGYNPCLGDAPTVADKLTGAFSYSPAAEIYKLAAQAAVPPVVRALQTHQATTGEPVTLRGIYDAFAKDKGLSFLGRQVGDPHREELAFLENQTGGRGPASEAYVGFALRLSALLQGKFGHLFERQPALDWEQVVAEPAVTYLALPATAGAGDVELMARVIIQDLKELCARRFAADLQGEQLRPVLVIFDEAAALRESETIVDLLLQARAAQLRCVVSLQYLPESVPIRESCFGAGLLIVHRVTSAAANELAEQFGTRQRGEVTHQLDYATGSVEKGSLRRVDSMVVHPNKLRDMPRGYAAIRSVHSGEKTIVHVYKVPAPTTSRTRVK